MPSHRHREPTRPLARKSMLAGIPYAYLFLYLIYIYIYIYIYLSIYLCVYTYKCTISISISISTFIYLCIYTYGCTISLSTSIHLSMCIYECTVLCAMYPSNRGLFGPEVRAQATGGFGGRARRSGFGRAGPRLDGEGGLCPK